VKIRKRTIFRENREKVKEGKMEKEVKWKN
jgi:hypothetical protein